MGIQADTLHTSQALFDGDQWAVDCPTIKDSQRTLRNQVPKCKSM